MNKNYIYVEDVYIEDLFKWFYEHILDAGGDGGGLIVCKNYKEAADLFIRWWKKKYNNENFFHRKDEYINIINFHDSNESFMFSDTTQNMFDGEYTFVVKKNCYFGNHRSVYDENNEYEKYRNVKLESI